MDPSCSRPAASSSSSPSTPSHSQSQSQSQLSSSSSSSSIPNSPPLPSSQLTAVGQQRPIWSPSGPPQQQQQALAQAHSELPVQTQAQVQAQTHYSHHPLQQTGPNQYPSPPEHSQYQYHHPIFQQQQRPPPAPPTPSSGLGGPRAGGSSSPLARPSTSTSSSSSSNSSTSPSIPYLRRPGNHAKRTGNMEVVAESSSSASLVSVFSASQIHDPHSPPAHASSSRPHRGHSTPFPLPVGKRSLGGLAALDEQTGAAMVDGWATAVGKLEPAPLGKTRCYWALLSSEPGPDDSRDLRFMYCDPVLQNHLGTEADLILGRSLFEFVHPAEVDQARSDLDNIVTSKTLFGSVTRCRYYRVPAIRSYLGCSNPPRTNDAHLYTTDDYFLPIDVVLNMVGESVALCFFHAIMNKSVHDNDESNKTEWTNWCGTPRELFGIEECNKIWAKVAASQMDKVARPLNPAAPSPEYVFQILSMPAADIVPEIIFSWPPPRFYPDEQSVPAYSSHEAFEDGSYFADEFARLAHGVRTSPSGRTETGQTARNGEPGTIQDGANTSCTRRFRAKHTLTTEGMLRSIESVLVPYGTIMLAFFNTTYQQIMNRASNSQPDGLRLSSSPQSTLATPPERITYDSSHFKRSRADACMDDSWGAIEAGSSVPQSHVDPGWSAGFAAKAMVTGHPSSFYPGAPFATSPGRDPQMGSPDSLSGQAHAKRRTDSSMEQDSLPGEKGTNTTSSRSGTDNAEGKEGEKRCTSCGTSNSPEWRKGPTGQKTLCNACGLRFSRSVSRQQRKEEKARASGAQAAGKDKGPPARLVATGPGSIAASARSPSGHQYDHVLARTPDAGHPMDPFYPRTTQWHSEGDYPGGPSGLRGPGSYGQRTAAQIASMGWGPPPQEEDPRRRGSG